MAWHGRRLPPPPPLLVPPQHTAHCLPAAHPNRAPPVPCCATTPLQVIFLHFKSFDGPFDEARHRQFMDVVTSAFAPGQIARPSGSGDTLASVVGGTGPKVVLIYGYWGDWAGLGPEAAPFVPEGGFLQRDWPEQTEIPALVRYDTK